MIVVYQLHIVSILGVNNVEEDSYVDETPETVAKYIVDQLVASVTAPAGKYNGTELLSWSLCLLRRVELSHFIVLLVTTL